MFSETTEAKEAKLTNPAQSPDRKTSTCYVLMAQLIPSMGPTGKSHTRCFSLPSLSVSSASRFAAHLPLQVHHSFMLHLT